jgi:probable HAF family extracellular repeat protein
MDINNSDEIVGDYRGRQGSTGFYLSGSTFKALPILSNSAVAFRINERGDVVGFSYFRNAYSHAVLWTNVRAP